MSEENRWEIHHGDCIEHMATLPDAMFDLSVFSPPFPALYAYTDSECDIGNSEDLRGDAKIHLSFFYHQLRRVMKPGRVIVVHVMQIPRLKRAGLNGTHDFRGLNIRLGERAGLIYEYDWAVSKNPQSQAIRTRSRAMQFAGLEADRAQSYGAFPDYLIKFRVPGENSVPVNSPGQVGRQDWIDWAESVWTWHDVRQTDTLNVKDGRGDDDTRHICPLQLEVIRRLVLLYSNPDELVFSPFTGIGSEGYVAIKHDRRFYGCEIKDEYIEAARSNLRAPEDARESQLALFQ